MKTAQDIKQELGVNNLVIMCQSMIINKSDSAGTFGLAGCTCAVAEKGDKLYLGHFPPTQNEKMILELLSFAPEKVTIFTPGEWKENSGKWEIEPKQKHAQINADYVSYSEMQGVDDTIHSTAVSWIGGKIVSGFLY